MWNHSSTLWVGHELCDEEAIIHLDGVAVFGSLWRNDWRPAICDFNNVFEYSKAARPDRPYPPQRKVRTASGAASKPRAPTESGGGLGGCGSGGCDPFFSLKAEVEAAINDIVEGLPQLTPREVTEAMERIKWDIEMMEDSIDRQRFGEKIGECNREWYCKLKKYGVRSERGASRESRPGEVTSFCVFALVALIMREQDESLDDLSLAVTRIGQMGLTIHHELKEQESLIDDLHERTDYSVNNMSDVNKLVSEMLQNRQGRNQLCLICILTTALVVVTTLIFLLP
ncbi:Qc-snare [Guillardia theta CCMP2712]|uniref:Qc-snare n=1 Tax=Guillardia theta (strain CCMP2712) TaxID=905079 RepID=L1J9J8_GUITC|nr:Qc-snare [Guillardia theta CCMP2712]EKX44745.1 Qc-snare [Guillardia theta CCMP2712]|eukprot:XP_005831725.1 Qc-snare [Guillardia theta CCMP2712]